MSLFDEALALVAEVRRERDKALAAGDLVTAKIRDSELRQSKKEFWSACHDPVFTQADDMDLTEAQAAEIDRLVAGGRCRMLTDSWTGLGARLKRETLAAKRG